jgi:D-alanyl-D-alanine carboxypeptidase (penicillin-binding protein 5/6)
MQQLKSGQFIAPVLALVFGFAGQFFARAATPENPKPTSSAKSAGKSRSGIIARSPYLGAIVVDAASGKVLFEDHADEKGYPASMLKLMDLLLILEKIEQGQLSLKDRVPVSARAANVPESHVALREKETFPLEDMLYAIMVKSANDAAIALAEKVGGSVEKFTALMNKKARDLGMTNTVFRSVNGLPPAPGEEHDLTTARDFAILSRELVLKHPEALRYTATRERVFRPHAGERTVRMVTHNHLLARVPGCDGLKTGFTTQSGYSIAATATRNGQRVIAIVLDSAEMNTRDARAAELLMKGFAALGAPAPTTVTKAAGTKATK